MAWLSSMGSELNTSDPLRRARLVFKLVAARLDRSVLELVELKALLAPLLPPDDPEEVDAICHPGRAGLARSYAVTLEALLGGCLASALVELDAALRATVNAPSPPLEGDETVLTRRFRALGAEPREPVMGLELAAVAAARQLLAEMALTEGRDLTMKIDTPIDTKLKSERVQLAQVGWHQLEGGPWESLYLFTTEAAARDFLRQAEDLIATYSWPIRVTLEGTSTLRALLETGPHGLTQRDITAIQALHRLYGGEGAEP